MPETRTDEGPKLLDEFIQSVDSVLKKLNKQWIFVFGQINRIFARPHCQTAKDVGVLPFPFYYMKRVMKPGRISSIISASVNNEIAYKDSHPGFIEYHHPLSMERHEFEFLVSIVRFKDQRGSR